MYFIYFIFSFSYVFHPGCRQLDTAFAQNLISPLPEANLGLPYKVVVIKEFLP